LLGSSYYYNPAETCYIGTSDIRYEWEKPLYGSTVVGRLQRKGLWTLKTKLYS
jgi:hypothetical protein